ncbi:MAG: hypothetical protein N2316_03950 [Spirochaetes bacterium]|nr:hypothetical protein [Spirochaetota bacterium]
MRSKKTNFLQTIVLCSGIVYISIGSLFALSPHLFGNVFFLEINEDWFMEIPKDSFMFASITLARALAALLFTIGLAMVLPLFDPVKYRALVYFTNVLFPFISSIIFIKSSFTNPLPVLIGFSVIFMLIGAFAFIALMVTRDVAKTEE